MWGLRRRLVTLVLAASLLGACGTDDAAPARDHARPPAVEVRVERSRLFEQQRALGVTVRNGGAAAAAVDQFRFDDGPYEAVPATDRSVTIPAGAELSFPVPYGPARCDADVDQLVVRFALDGEPTARRVPLSDQIRRARQRECDTARAREAVDVVFADDWRLVAPRRARGSLLVRELGERDVEVLGVTTSIVFVTGIDGATSPDGRVPLEVVASRCDVHALIESKRSFTFAVELEVDGGPPVAIDVVPEDGAARDVLQQAIEGCVDEEPAR